MEILAGVPVVQVDNGESDQPTREAYGMNAVHISFNIDARKTIDLAKHLQPRARKVLVIAAASADDHVYLDQFRKRLAEEPDLTIEAIGDKSAQELTDILSHASPDDIVLSVTYFSDLQGNNTYISTDVVRQLAVVSAAPVYAASDTYIGRGTVGGYVVSWEKTGNLTTDAATLILRGKKRQTSL